MHKGNCVFNNDLDYGKKITLLDIDQVLFVFLKCLQISLHLPLKGLS